MSKPVHPVRQPNPQPQASVWLTVEQIRKQQRMRRERVIEAMGSGELPHERRGRVRYARLSDVLAWEERRLQRIDNGHVSPGIRSDLADLL